MWKLIKLLLGVLLISCNQDNSSKKTSNNFINDSTISNTRDIFGHWTMCATSGNGVMIQGNTCKNIVFNNNGIGYIENNSLISENFNWTLKKPGMKIINYVGINSPTFPDTFYYAFFTKSDSGIDLILSHNDNSYYLSK